MKKITRLFLALLLMGSSVGSAKAQGAEWTQKNSSITCITQKPGSPNTIFVGDVFGLIRMSPDQGKTWQIAYNNDGVGLNSIAFLDANTGFAATTQSGLALKTTDGGQTWKRLQFTNASKTATYYPAGRVFTVSTNIVYFDVFNHPISNPTPKQAIVSRDGGATFNLEFCPGHAYCLPGDTMLAFGAEKDQNGINRFTTYSSLDKGLSWTIVATSPAGLQSSDLNNEGINLATFVNSKNFCITPEMRISTDRRIYHTRNGGATFKALSYTNSSSNKTSYLCFKDTSNGFANDYQGFGISHYTSDGGKTWQTANKDVNEPVIYGGNDLLLARKGDHMAVSTDFGRTWTEQSDAANSVGQGFTANSYFFQVVDENVAFSLYGYYNNGTGSSSGGLMTKTSDGGLSWHNVKVGGTNLKAAVGALDANKFFYVGGSYANQIYYTADGGQTSTSVYPGDFVAGGIFKFCLMDKKNIMACAGSSTIFSADSGQTWKKTALSQTPTAVSAPALKSWYIISFGQVFKSADTGRTWNNMSNGISGSLSAINFMNPDTGYVCGSTGVIFKTTDGGQNWSALRNNLPGTALQYENYAGLARQNDSTVYMHSLGLQSKTVVSTNGGTTWAQNLELSTGVVSIQFPQENKGGLFYLNGLYATRTGPLSFNPDTIIITQTTNAVKKISGRASGSSMSIYPNPAQQEVNIQLPGEELFEISLTDLTGKTVLKQEATNTCQLRLYGLSRGIYLVNASSAKESYVSKLIVQ